MKTKTLYIKNPSAKLLNFARKLQADKVVRREELLSQKDKFFPKMA